MYVYLYNYAETDLKIRPHDATKFLSVIGKNIFDLIL